MKTIPKFDYDVKVITAMVTPFKEDDNQSVDFENVIQLANYLVNNGTDSLLLKGSTDILVLFNGDSREWVRFNLPQSGTWKVVCDGEKIDDAGLYTAEGDYNVPPTTAVILIK